MHRFTPLAAGLDAAVITLFVAIGQREHDQDTDPANFLDTAIPFYVGLLVAWLVVRTWRRPTSWLTGLLMWPITVLVGMLIRSIVFDDGTATAFVVVATAFIGLFLIGWRAVFGLVTRRRRDRQLIA